MTGITTTVEGGGYVTTCHCGWTRYATTQAAMHTNRNEHTKKCKGPKTTPTQTAKPAARVKWDDREGATWMDSM